jgi:hypothetical protein
VKWFVAGVLVSVLLGPGTFALRRGRHARADDATRLWLGRAAAITFAAGWLALFLVLVLA